MGRKSRKSDELTAEARAARWWAVTDLADAIYELAKANAPREVIGDLTDKIAHYLSPDDDTPLDLLVAESCRKYRWFDLFEEPHWIELETEDDDGTPILAAYTKTAADGTLLARVWCRYCFRWHTHSGQPGNRAAHCHDSKSPYQRTGYNLRIAGKMPPGADEVMPALKARWRNFAATTPVPIRPQH